MTASSRPPASLPRSAYADMFGPTTGDRIRLADTCLEIEVERDLTTYAFTDANAARLGRLLYYRLRQVDADGTATYSPVRAVRFDSAPAEAAIALSLYPNPATAQASAVTLDLSTLPQGTYQATVLDATGRRVATYSVVGGVNKDLPVQALPSGVYLVQVRGNSLSLTQRLIKE